MTRRRKLLAAVVIALPFLAYAGWCGYVRLRNPAVQSNTLVGISEARLHGSYGTPDEDRQGYHSLGLKGPPSLPPGPIRTLIFHPRGLFHPEGGTLWVWVVERNGQWYCFQSCWYAHGVSF